MIHIGPTTANARIVTQARTQNLREIYTFNIVFDDGFISYDWF
jgi:hypothetical protein